MKNNIRTAGTASKTLSAALIVLLITAAISACQPSVTPAARPTPQVMTVQMTPALTIYSEQYRKCVEEMPGVGLAVLERPASALDLDQSYIALRWGAGENLKGYAAVIGQDELVIVVHPKNPLTRISLTDLQAIYQGSQKDWQEPAPAGEIQAWAYPSGDDVQAVFQGAVLDGAPAAQSAVSMAPNPEAMREAVAANPAAIGFLPKRWIDGSIKTLTVSGLDAARLAQPLLSISKSEPKDPEKSWLICVQEQLQ